MHQNIRRYFSGKTFTIRQVEVRRGIKRSYEQPLVFEVLDLFFYAIDQKIHTIYVHYKILDMDETLTPLLNRIIRDHFDHILLTYYNISPDLNLYDRPDLFGSSRKNFKKAFKRGLVGKIL